MKYKEIIMYVGYSIYDAEVEQLKQNRKTNKMFDKKLRNLFMEKKSVIILIKS